MMSFTPLAKLEAIEKQSAAEREIEQKRTAIIENAGELLALLAREQFKVMRFGSRAYSDEAARRHCQEAINDAEHRVGDLASEQFNDWYSAR